MGFEEEEKKKQNRKIITTPFANPLSFWQSNFKPKPVSTKEKKISDHVDTNVTWIMKQGISDPKLLGFDYKQLKIHTWHVSA